ncbi:MAG: universal stress protein [Bacteroidota bacterium]
MKKILVPTDFSTCADNAVNVALEVAQKVKAEIQFVHCLPVPTDWISLGSDQDNFYPEVNKRIKETGEELKELCRKAQKRGVVATTYLGLNDGTKEISDYVEKTHVDLIVMGSKGARGWKEMVLGSNAQRIIRSSSAPVMIVKPATKHLNAVRMVIVSDFLGAMSSDLEDTGLASFMKLARIATDLSIPLHFLYINTPEHFISTRVMMNRMKNYEEESGVTVVSKQIVDAGSLEKGLEDFLAGDTDSIIAMMTHGTQGLLRVLSGSTVEMVANHTESPFLSVKL